jgi:hypothetical protein
MVSQERCTRDTEGWVIGGSWSGRQAMWSRAKEHMNPLGLYVTLRFHNQAIKSHLNKYFTHGNDGSSLCLICFR